MTRYLYDALYVQAMYDAIHDTIEPDAIVASYIDHPEVIPPCMEELARLFPSHIQVGISAHGHPAKILDCESGAILPGDIPSAVNASRLAGYDVAVYASPDNWDQVVNLCNQASVALPLWWEVKRGAPIISPGSVGNQYLGAGPYDKSIITDEWATILDPPIGVDMFYSNSVADGGWLILGCGKVALRPADLNPDSGAVPVPRWDLTSDTLAEIPVVPVAPDGTVPTPGGPLSLKGTFSLTEATS